MSFPRRGIWGVGKGIGWVSASASLEGLLPILDFYTISSLLLVARGNRLSIGHTGLPMKEHLAQPESVTALRGRPRNYGHVKAIARALL